MKPHSYTHLVFDKVQKTHSGEKEASSATVAGKISCRKLKLDP
jgi:hypothetical protein